jgi:hypothetical protein
MAPGQVERRSATAKSDPWSFCATLYEECCIHPASAKIFNYRDRAGPELALADIDAESE